MLGGLSKLQRTANHTAVVPATAAIYTEAFQSAGQTPCASPLARLHHRSVAGCLRQMAALSDVVAPTPTIAVWMCQCCMERSGKRATFSSQCQTTVRSPLGYYPVRRPWPGPLPVRPPVVDPDVRGLSPVSRQSTLVAFSLSFPMCRRQCIPRNLEKQFTNGHTACDRERLIHPSWPSCRSSSSV